MKNTVILLTVILSVITIGFSIGSVGTNENFSSLVKSIKTSNNTVYADRWQFVAVAEYPVDSMKTKRVPDLSRGQIWSEDTTRGFGIVWYDRDTCCVIVKTWARKDTTYRFLWYKKSSKGWGKSVLLK